VTSVIEGFTFIGKRIPRKDAELKVTGKAQFTSDIWLPGMLYGRILKSPYAHAIIRRIDTSEAERLGAVVITWKDVPNKLYNPRLVSIEEDTFKDWQILTNHPRFVGEPIAAVAAPSEEVAQRALEALRIEVEKVYKPILDPFESMMPGAPKIHEKILRGNTEISVENNVGATLEYSEGDVDKAFREADVVIERKFKTNRRYHFTLEPRGAVCRPDPDGGITVWSTTQTIHNTKILISQLFDIPQSKVRVVKTYLGGGFGSSIHVNHVTLIAVALCLKARRPVKLILTREEDMMHDHVSYQMYFRIKTGAKRDGTLMAGEFENIMDIGAHQIQAYPLLGTALGWFVSLYKWRNIRYIGKAVYTNKVPACAFRGYGNPQVTWAVETVIDELAKELGIDPVEFRLKNYKGKGEIFWGQGPTVRSVIRSDGVPELMDVGKKWIGWERRNKLPKTGRFRRGIGVARGFHTSGAGGPISGSTIDYTGAVIKVNEDGTIDYITALQDHGGGTIDAHVKIIAEELQVPPEKINVVPVDTSITPYDVCTHASRGVYVGGEAARRAAQEIKRKIKELAMRYFEQEYKERPVNFEAIRIKYDPKVNDAVIYVEGTNMRIPLSELAKLAWQKNWGTLIASVTYRSTVAPPSFTVYFVEVEVDTGTGIVRPVRVFAGADIGTVINPDLAAGQIHGGFMMGWSWATLEDTVYDPKTGELLNKGLVIDYKIPTAQDTPKLKDFYVYFAHTYEPTGPYGAKGIGEAAANPVPAVIANAIANALGIRFYELPITPERILEALKKKEKG